jgi:hypothetical protein
MRHAVLRVVVTVATALLATWTMPTPEATAAPGVVVEQPAIRPRIVATWGPIRHYAPPGPARASALHEVSHVRLLRSLETSVTADARHRLAPELPAEVILRAARTPVQEDLRSLAARSVSLGMEYYRQYNLRSAIDQLEDAVALLMRTTLPWSDPAEVAEVWRTIGLAYLERAESDPDRASNLEARALAAFREMIRWQPSGAIDDSSYPVEVVSAYERAYLDHMLSGGSDLRLRLDEARRLSEMLGVDDLVYAFTLATDDERLHVGLQYYDARAGAFIVDELRPVTDDESVVEDTLSELVSDALACQPLRRVETRNPNDDTGHLYVSNGYAGTYFLETPTRQPFYIQGFGLRATWFFNEYAGLSAGGQFVFGRRDPDGDLLRRVDTARADVSAAFQLRWSRVRVHGTFGVNAAFLGSVEATEDFWCKVTGGEARMLDPSRRCPGSAITGTPAQSQLGLSWTAFVGARLFGPFWLDIGGDFTAYMLPFEERPFDLPVGVVTALTYRF